MVFKLHQTWKKKESLRNEITTLYGEKNQVVIKSL